jgi:hypothetical protein
MDCRFWAGLEVDPQDAYIMSIVGILAKSDVRETIYTSIPPEYRTKVHALMGRPFREKE